MKASNIKVLQIKTKKNAHPYIHLYQVMHLLQLANLLRYDVSQSNLVTESSNHSLL